MSDGNTKAHEPVPERLRGWMFAVGRRLHSAPWLIYVIVFILGAGGSWLTFAPTRMTGGLEKSGAISLQQRSVWWVVLALSITTTLVTVSMFELLKLILEQVRSFLATRMAFNGFWGIGASTRGNEGIILLQEEDLEETVSKLTGGQALFAKAKTATTNDNRFFKAITWVNKWDAEAAKHIRAEFWKLHYAPPEMKHIRSAESYAAPPSAPFVISVGLFSAETRRFIKEYSGEKNLIEVTQTEEGDAIVLFHSLVADTDGLRCTGSDLNMRTLIPEGWDRPKWAKGDATNDYAIISRHTLTKQDSPRFVRFVVAGFTEHGTEAAGKYLGRHWRSLHQKFWSNPELSGRRGDFFLVIQGRSTDTDNWVEAPGINPITPQLMAETHRILIPNTGASSAVHTAN
jgi:hypothetical protein